MAKVISWINHKGGVGKTSAAYNTCIILAKSGYKVLLIDVDPNKNATKPYQGQGYKYSVVNLFENKNFNTVEAIIPAHLENDGIFTLIENFWLIPSDLSLISAEVGGKGPFKVKVHQEKIIANHIKKIEDQFDIIIIDSPPSLTDYTINAIYAGDLIFIPIQYAKDALEGVSDLFTVINEIKENQNFNYKILRNAYHPCKKNANEATEKTLEPFVNNSKVFKTIIPQDEAINLAKFDDMPVIAYDKNCRGTKAYIALAEEIEEIINEEI